MYGEGISKEGSILDAAVNNDLIIKSGSWYSYGDARIGQGRENARQYLKENSELAAELDKKIREMFNLGISRAKSADEEDMQADTE